MLLFTDIDGTLLNRDNSISEKNFEALAKLNNIIKVAITGRNLLSAKRVLPQDTPIDFLAFSNGAGVINWKNGELIYSQNLNHQLTTKLINFLKQLNITFTVHKPIPDSHFYYFNIGKYTPEDLKPRNQLYANYIKPLNTYNANAACIICMLSQNEKEFSYLEQALSGFSSEISITRTTSPINHKNIWLEIYPKNVNKGKTAEFLCNYLAIPRSQTIGVGNDYNDISLLKFVAYPFVVENAPEDLKKLFPVLPHHNDDAIAFLVDNFLKNVR
jgi:Cof subfamily protein (haloacid dehalogenase superfamily)